MEQKQTLTNLFNWFAYHSQALEDASQYCGCSSDELEETLEHSSEVSEIQFQECLMEHYKEDALKHAEDRRLSLSDEEAYKLAEEFSKRKDCNVADNDIWDDIFGEFIRN